MVAVRNWQKVSDLEYAYKPDARIRVLLRNNTESVRDKRRSLWSATVVVSGEEVYTITSGERTKKNARTEANYWIENNILTSVDELQEDKNQGEMKP